MNSSATEKKYKKEEPTELGPLDETERDAMNIIQKTHYNTYVGTTKTKWKLYRRHRRLYQTGFIRTPLRKKARYG